MHEELAVALVEDFRGASFPDSWRIIVTTYTAPDSDKRAFVSTRNHRWKVKGLGTSTPVVMEW